MSNGGSPVTPERIRRVGGIRRKLSGHRRLLAPQVSSQPIVAGRGEFGARASQEARLMNQPGFGRHWICRYSSVGLTGAMQRKICVALSGHRVSQSHPNAVFSE